MTRAVLCLVLVACSGGSHAQPDPHPTGGDMNKKPDAGTGIYEHGMATSPATALLKWLDTQKARLRVPVILKPGMTGWKNRGAKLGNGGDAIELYCNDSALGIGLSDRVGKLCPPGSKPTCTVWLVGTWRGKVDDAYQLDVTAVGELIADPAQADHVEIEATGN